ncbi:MAG TPA: hypothetical protein VHE99_09790 [Gammaproteobacteria bacterium]|nr:hypothetical protein [Gammaproteobacteria bacterium]
MLLNYFKSMKALAVDSGSTRRYILSGINLLFVGCLVVVLLKSAALLPITIACEILAKFLLGHLIEKWMLRAKEKLLNNSIG